MPYKASNIVDENEEMMKNWPKETLLSSISPQIFARQGLKL